MSIILLPSSTVNAALTQRAVFGYNVAHYKEEAEVRHLTLGG